MKQIDKLIKQAKMLTKPEADEISVYFAYMATDDLRIISAGGVTHSNIDGIIARTEANGGITPKWFREAVLCGK